MSSWAPLVGPFLCYLGVSCQGLREQMKQERGRWRGPDMARAYSLASCLEQVGGLGKGAPAFAPRAQPSKPCSGRRLKKLLPLLPHGCPSASCPGLLPLGMVLHSGSSPPFLLSGPPFSPITLCCELSC